MTELHIQDPCVLFALGREAKSFVREFRPQQSFKGAPCRSRFCGPAWLSVLVLETGMGAAATETALSWLLDKPELDQVPYQPKVVISAGFAGAIQEHHAVGDVILATEVVDEKNESWPATWPGELPAGEWRPRLHRGRVLSTSRILGSAEEKRRLGRQYGALVVDLESATAARLCAKHDVPFGCVRVVSDDMHTSLSPAVLSLIVNERISLLSLLPAFFTSPGVIPELWRLARHTRFAGEQLRMALGELLTLTMEGGREL